MDIRSIAQPLNSAHLKLNNTAKNELKNIFMVCFLIISVVFAQMEIGY